MLDRAGLWRRNKMEDLIYIKDLRVQTIIGIFGWEREVRQEVSIDLEMTFDCKRAAKTDAIEDTIDYKKLLKESLSLLKSLNSSSKKPWLRALLIL